MKTIKTYILHATIITIAIGTPKVVYGDTSNLSSKIYSNYGAMKVTGIDFNNKDKINKLTGGRFFLGDFNADDISTTEDIKIILKGSNFKNVEKVRLVGENNKEFSLYSSKEEVYVDDKFEKITLTIKDPIKKEIFGDFRDADGFFKNKKNTGKYYFYIDTVEELSNGSINRNTIKVDEKYYMEILDTISPKGTEPRNRERYFNPEDLKIGDTYYVKIDFDNSNDNFNYIKYSKGEGSNREEIRLDPTKQDGVIGERDINIRRIGDDLNLFDSSKELIVRKGSLYIPIKNKPEDGVNYEVVYIDDFFIDSKIIKEIDSNKNNYEKIRRIEDDISKLKAEIKDIEKSLKNSELTNGEKLILEKKLKKSKSDLKSKENELSNLQTNNSFADLENNIRERITSSRHKFNFTVNIMPKLEKQYEGFVVEDYSDDYPILLEGKDFNNNMEVEFYGDGRYYRADQVRVEKDFAYVYLPNRRKLRPGMYDIILRNVNKYETEVKYGVLSVVESGKFIPNEEFFVKSEVDKGKVISLRSTSEDVLELNSDNNEKSHIEIDLDEVLGAESWTRTIDFSQYSRSNIFSVDLTSSLFNLKIENLINTGYNKENPPKIRVGKATPYIVESFRDSLSNFSIKSDFIEVNIENTMASSYRIDIPFRDSDGKNLRILRYDEDLRVFNTISSTINIVDGLVQGLSLDPGIFVVVE